MNLSLFQEPDIQCVLRMQEVQQEINTINEKIYKNEYNEDQIEDKKHEITA